MGIVATRELGRTFENEVGSSGGKAKRRWVCSLSDDTLTGGAFPTLDEIAAATAGSSFGAYHPTHTLLRLRKLGLNERFEDDPYKLEVIGEYGFVKDDELLAPAARASVWSFESRPGEVPALYYYDGAGNTLADQRPLTNSAYDFFPGLTTEESLVRVKIQKNYVAYPSEWLQAQNCVNAGEFLGCPADSVKVAAVEATYTTEIVSNVTYAFYAATASLEFRQSGHSLRLPDVGYNFIDPVSSQKRRGMVFDFQNGEWVPSPNPVPLNGSGGQVLNGPPSILTRRVSPRVNFTALFGSPP